MAACFGVLLVAYGVQFSYGFVWAIAASAAALGPLIAGYLYDVTGSYGDAFALSAALNQAAGFLVLLLRKPAPP